MLYNIDGKIYILASGYYKEVNIEKNPLVKNDYVVKVVKSGNKIEAKHDESKPTIALEKAYKHLNSRRFEFENK